MKNILAARLLMSEKVNIKKRNLFLEINYIFQGFK